MAAAATSVMIDAPTMAAATTCGVYGNVVFNTDFYHSTEMILIRFFTPGFLSCDFFLFLGHDDQI
jgi:hypothetical protein